jgi:hypothetical protein
MIQKTLISLCISTLLIQTEGWIPVGSGSSCRWNRRNTVAMTTGDQGSDDPLSQQACDARKEQEMILEELSLRGADKISKMGIPERAKRAMLAEAVEDRIFELTDVLEGLIEEDGSVAVENREEAVEIAKQTKSLKQQYSDLVNGNPSSILTALDGTADKSKDC